MMFLLVICLCFFSCATVADGVSTNASLQQSTAPTIHASPPLQRTNKNGPKIGNSTCSGWCLIKLKPSHSLNLITNETVNGKLNRTLYLIKAMVENADAYPVRLEANVFADKRQYNDDDANQSRSRIFDKNLLNVPTIIFFPYTRTAVKKAIMDSGNVYIPNINQKTFGNKPLQLRNNSPYGFLWKQPIFTNRYFESNPLLHTNMRVSNPKTKAVGMNKKHFNDPYNIGNNRKSVSLDYGDGIEEPNKKYNSLQVKTSTLTDFVNNALAKKKTKGIALGQSQVKQILGVPNEETILEHPRNTVDDIIGGMRIGSKDVSTFIIGTTKNARSKIIKWVGQKGRSKKLPNAHDTGMLLKGKSRARAIDIVLKSMVQSYQYANNKPTYKKLPLNQ